MTSYTINGIDAAIKVGTFVAYASTATPPDGWIACDGVQKANTDNIYGTLITMGIGSGTGTQVSGVFPNYKSPDLSGQIMTGLLANPTGLTLNNSSGSDSISLSVSNLPEHTHTITIGDSTHTHSYKDYSPTLYNETQNLSNEKGDNSENEAVSRTTGSADIPHHIHTTTIQTVSNYSSLGSINIKNKSFYIVWIVKYI